MKPSQLVRVIAAVAVALPMAAMAQQAPQVKVKVDDLDLTRDAGVRTANNRLKGGVERQCPEAGRDLQSQKAAGDCRRDLLARGHAAVADASERREAEKLAEQRQLAEVSIHPRRVRRPTAYQRTPGHVVANRAAQRPAVKHKPTSHAAARHPAPTRHVVVRHSTGTAHRKHR